MLYYNYKKINIGINELLQKGSSLSRKEVQCKWFGLWSFFNNAIKTRSKPVRFIYIWFDFEF